jgi:hypothetical protein
MSHRLARQPRLSNKEWLFEVTITNPVLPENVRRLSSPAKHPIHDRAEAQRAVDHIHPTGRLPDRLNGTDGCRARSY